MLLPTLSVRGITQSSPSSHFEQPNAVYVDDIYVISPAMSGFPLYDLDRIEVLRGPQGTLFGRNSTGGLAHFITARPTDTVEGYAELGYGEFNQFYGEGAVSGPLSDRVRGRLAGRAEKSDGWWKNRAPGGRSAFNKKFWGLRGQLEFDVTPDLMARVAVSYDKNPRTREGTYKGAELFRQCEWFFPSPCLQTWMPTVRVRATALSVTETLSLTHRKALSTAPARWKGERDSQTLELEWTPGDITITSLTNRTKFKMDYGPEDFDGSPIEFATGPLVQDLEQWSQELRATGQTDRLTWTTGFYYLDVDQTGSTGFDFPSSAGTDFAFSSFNNLAQTTETYAIFGQVEWNLTEDLRLTTGLRYTHDDITFSSQAFFNELGNGFFGFTGSTVFVPPLLVADFSPATVGDAATQKEGLWSGKLQLDYIMGEGKLLYGSVSRGVKGPGFNGNIDGGLTNDRIPFGFRRRDCLRGSVVSLIFLTVVCASTAVSTITTTRTSRASPLLAPRAR